MSLGRTTPKVDSITKPGNCKMSSIKWRDGGGDAQYSLSNRTRDFLLKKPKEEEKFLSRISDINRIYELRYCAIRNCGERPPVSIILLARLRTTERSSNLSSSKISFKRSDCTSLSSRGHLDTFRFFNFIGQLLKTRNILIPLEYGIDFRFSRKDILHE